MKNVLRKILSVLAVFTLAVVMSPWIAGIGIDQYEVVGWWTILTTPVSIIALFAFIFLLMKGLHVFIDEFLEK